jgi:hypothetical protein
LDQPFRHARLEQGATLGLREQPTQDLADP